MARKRIGVPQMPLVDMIRHVVKLLGRTKPETKHDGYMLLKDWCSVTPLPKRQAPRPVVTQPSKRKQRKAAQLASDEFLASYEWRALRMRVITKRGARCECCGASPKDGVVIHVDHVKPRKLFPELALDEANLQVLCEVCNHGKGNWDETDWREARPRLVKPA